MPPKRSERGVDNEAELDQPARPTEQEELQSKREMEQKEKDRAACDYDALAALEKEAADAAGSVKPKD